MHQRLKLRHDLCPFDFANKTVKSKMPKININFIDNANNKLYIVYDKIKITKS